MHDGSRRTLFENDSNEDRDNDIQRMAQINRTEEQEKIAGKLLEGGIVIGATGVGKARIIIRAVTKIRELFPEYKCVWAVPFAKLRDEDVPAEIKKWKTTEKFQYDTVCYRSLLDYSGGDILVLDEFQHITPDNMQGYMARPPKIIIAASATPPRDDDKKAIIKHFKLKTVAKIHIKEALEKNYVQDFNLIVLLKALDKQVKYVPGFKYQGLVTEEQRNIDLNRTIARIRDDSGKPPFFMLLQRKRFLGSVRSKEGLAKIVLEKWKDKKVLIFCSSIEQAERICPYTYHSKTDSMHLEHFESNKINHLACVEALDEGANIKNVDYALILRVDAEIRRLVQRIGRVIRKKETQEPAKVCIIVAKDTQEQVWLDTNIKAFNLPEGKIIYKEYE